MAGHPPSRGVVESVVEIIDADESGPDRTRASRIHASRLRQTLDSLGWALCGFLIGAVFWHFVGFWSFVTTIVLKGPETIQEGAPVVTHRVANCTMLVLDRRHGGTTSEPCSDIPLRLEARSTGRGDRAVVALRPNGPAANRAWSTTLERGHDEIATVQQ